MTGTNDKIRSLFLAALMVFAVFAGTIALSGSAAAAVGNQSDVDYDDKLDSQQVFWQGQALLIDASSTYDNATWQVWSVTDDDQLDNLVQEFNLDENGTAVVNTANLDGEYVVTTADRTVVEVTNGNAAVGGTATVASSSWGVTTQNLDAAFASDSVGNAGDTAEVALGITSNRGNYNVTVTATRDGSSVGEDSLLAIVPNSRQGAVDDGAVVVSAQADSTKVLNFSGMTAGNYTFSLAVTDTTASSTATVQVTDVGEGTASFATNTVDVPQGDVATITVELSEAAVGGTSYMQIGSKQAGYRANVTLTDVDADGEVTVMFNTYKAGTAMSGIVSAAGDDTATIDQSTTNLGLLDQGDYGLAVGLQKPWEGNTADDLGSLFLTERSVDSANLWTAPATADAATTADIAAVATEDTSVAAGDLAIIELQASGLGGLVSAYGDLETAFTTSDVLGLSITQTAESTLPNRNSKQINVSESIAAGEIWFVSDSANDTYYAVIDTETVNWARLNDDGSLDTSGDGLSGGEAYSAVVTVEDNRLLDTSSDDAEPSVNTSMEIVERTLSLSGEVVSVQPEAGQTISGTSSAAPGTQIKVVVQSTGDTQPRFIKSTTTTVGADGSWSVAFDFSGQSIGDTFSVRATHVTGAGEDTATGEVQQAPTPTDTPTDTPTATPTDTPTATPTDSPEPPTTTTTTTPGFGIAVALVALLAAALLAVRRD